MNSSFALAMMAATATAFGGFGQNPYFSHDQQQHEQWNAPVAPISDISQHGQANYAGPQYQEQSYQPQQQYQQYPQQQQYQQYPQQQHWHQHQHQPQQNPWGTPAPKDDGVDKTGWYSQYQQYSDPKKQFEVVSHAEPIYAVCEGFGIQLQLAQLPDKPVQIRGTFNVGAQTDQTPYGVRIGTNGRLGPTDADYCRAENVGEEFNPLKEFDHYTHRPNPYQDPARGRIGDVVDLERLEEGTNYIILKFPDDEYVLQNLSGKDSLIGRSIILVTGEAEDPVDCCVIARDAAPVIEAPEAAPQQHHHHHQHQYQQAVGDAINYFDLARRVVLRHKPSHPDTQSKKENPQQYNQYAGW